MSSIKDGSNEKRFLPTPRISEPNKVILAKHGRTSSGNSLSTLISSSAEVAASPDGEIVAKRTIQTTTTRTETVGLSHKALNLRGFKKGAGGHAQKLIQAQDTRVQSGGSRASIEELADDTNPTAQSSKSKSTRNMHTSFTPFTPASSSEQFLAKQFRPTPPAFSLSQHPNSTTMSNSNQFNPPPAPFAWAKPDKSHTSSFPAPSETVTYPDDPAFDDSLMNAKNDYDYDVESDRRMDGIVTDRDLMLDDSSPMHGDQRLQSIAAGRGDLTDLDDMDPRESKKRRRPSDTPKHTRVPALQPHTLNEWQGKLSENYGDDDDEGAVEAELEDSRAAKRSKTKTGVQFETPPKAFSRTTTQSPPSSGSPQAKPYDQQTEQPYAQQQYHAGLRPHGDPYDMLNHLAEHNEKLEAARQRWRDCTMEEWIGGAKELMDKFDGLLDYVKDHMRRKLEMFTSLHQTLADHSQVLDQRENELQTAKQSLVAGAGNVVVGMGTGTDMEGR